jgi:hypothetical protein
MNMTRKRSFHASLWLYSVCLLILATACNSDSPDTGVVADGAQVADGADAPDAAEIQKLGFLENYEQLSRGREGQASLIYIDAEADFSDYSAFVVEPVVARTLSHDESHDESPGGSRGEAAGDLSVTTQQLAEGFEAALRRELAHEFEIIEQPRAGALRMRAALASKGDSRLILEAELLDGGTGARVVALVDDRKLEADGAADQVGAWATKIRDRLAMFRQFDSALRARGAVDAP